MTTARLAGATPGLLALLAVLLLAAYATAHRLRSLLQTRRTPDGHRAIVAAALEDWWITTDPLEPFTPDDVADQVDLYLHSSGYRITPDTRKTRMPTRRTIATAAVIALICATSTAFAVARGDWWWAAIGALATLLLTRETIRDLADRRHGRNAR